MAWKGLEAPLRTCETLPLVLEAGDELLQASSYILLWKQKVLDSGTRVVSCSQGRRSRNFQSPVLVHEAFQPSNCSIVFGCLHP